MTHHIYSPSFIVNNRLFYSQTIDGPDGGYETDIATDTAAAWCGSADECLPQMYIDHQITRP
jgi:hypothetical protein